MTTTPPADLTVRLRAMRDSGRRTLGGGSVGSGGKATFWGNEAIMELRNPDGPEAADRIEQQAEVIGKLREALRKIEGRVFGSSHNMGSDIVTIARAALKDTNHG